MVRPACLMCCLMLVVGAGGIGPAAAAELPKHERNSTPPREARFQPHWPKHSMRTWNMHGIPDHNYQVELSRPSVQAVTMLAVDEPKDNVVRKLFRLSTQKLTLDHLVLEQVAASLVKANGKLIFSGRVVNSGGRNGEVLGNYVTVRVRCFGGIDVEGIHAPDGPMFAEIEQRRWVAARKPEVFTLQGPAAQVTGDDMAASPNTTPVRGKASVQATGVDAKVLVEHFDEIRRLEVTLEYEKGR